jgi:peptidyl-prolyl cis-trans isomerase A (cyclophilin A)
MNSLHLSALLARSCGVAALISACNSAPKEPAPPPPAKPTATATAADPVTPESSAAPQPTTPPAFASGSPSAAAAVPTVPVSPDDPLKGVFTLADATQGLNGKGALSASIDTDLGKLECKLFDDKAPLTVANFIGLARGARPWKDPEGKWAKKPAYNGTVFHRVIKGFMIQGGDPSGTGAGEPGYVVPDEIWPGGVHDRAGLLCMANRGKNTNGAQFFITDAAAPHLDRGYTIFGECGPEEMVHKLASVDVQGERPKTPPKIKSVTIKRGS